MMEDGGRRELHDTGKVPVLQVFIRIQAAAGQDGILDAGGQKIFIAHLQIEIVQFLQKAVLRVIAQVLQVVTIGPAYGAFDLLHQLPANVRFLAGAILTL